MRMDIKNYYYDIPLPNNGYTYMHIALKLIPEEIVKQYCLLRLAVED